MLTQQQKSKNMVTFLSNTRVEKVLLVTPLGVLFIPLAMFCICVIHFIFGQVLIPYFDHGQTFRFCLADS